MILGLLTLIIGHFSTKEQALEQKKKRNKKYSVYISFQQSLSLNTAITVFQLGELYKAETNSHISRNTNLKGKNETFRRKSEKLAYFSQFLYPYI